MRAAEAFLLAFDSASLIMARAFFEKVRAEYVVLLHAWVNRVISGNDINVRVIDARGDRACIKEWETSRSKRSANRKAVNPLHADNYGQLMCAGYRNWFDDLKEVPHRR